MNYADKCTVVTLVRAIIDRGHHFSVVDPEDCIFDEEPATYSSFLGIEEFGHADEDFVVVKAANKEPMASFHLIYNNGNEFDPIITISDYSTGSVGEDIYQDVQGRLYTGSCNGLQTLANR